MKAVTPAILLGGALFASVLAPAFADQSSAPQNAVALHQAAPLDEYFGPLRMSPLGIRNDLKSMNARLDTGDASEPDAKVKHIALVENAIHDWEAHYPADAWIPSTISNLRTVYAKVPCHEAKLRAVDATTWLLGHYPHSDEAVSLRENMTAMLFDESDVDPNDPNATPGELAPPIDAQAAELSAPSPSQQTVLVAPVAAPPTTVIVPQTVVAQPPTVIVIKVQGAQRTIPSYAVPISVWERWHQEHDGYTTVSQ